MADAGFFKGTSAEQDSRFSNAQKKMMKTMKFAEGINVKIDMSKVNLDVIKPWIAKRVMEILDLDDDVVVDFALNQLEEKHPDPKLMQINLTGFLGASSARSFMGQLWKLLASAQNSPDGIPLELVELKKQEIKSKAEADERLREKIKRKEEEISRTVLRYRERSRDRKRRDERSMSNQRSNVDDTRNINNSEKRMDSHRSRRQKSASKSPPKRRFKEFSVSPEKDVDPIVDGSHKHESAAEVSSVRKNPQVSSISDNKVRSASRSSASSERVLNSHHQRISKRRKSSSDERMKRNNSSRSSGRGGGSPGRDPYHRRFGVDRSHVLHYIQNEREHGVRYLRSRNNAKAERHIDENHADDVAMDASNRGKNFKNPSAAAVSDVEISNTVQADKENAHVSSNESSSGESGDPPLKKIIQQEQGTWKSPSSSGDESPVKEPLKTKTSKRPRSVHRSPLRRYSNRFSPRSKRSSSRNHRNIMMRRQRRDSESDISDFERRRPDSRYRRDSRRRSPYPNYRRHGGSVTPRNIPSPHKHHRSSESPVLNESRRNPRYHDRSRRAKYSSTPEKSHKIRKRRQKSSSSSASQSSSESESEQDETPKRKRGKKRHDSSEESASSPHASHRRRKKTKDESNSDVVRKDSSDEKAKRRLKQKKRKKASDEEDKEKVKRKSDSETSSSSSSSTSTDEKKRRKKLKKKLKKKKLKKMKKKLKKKMKEKQAALSESSGSEMSTKKKSKKRKRSESETEVEVELEKERLLREKALKSMSLSKKNETFADIPVHRSRSDSPKSDGK